MASNKKNTFDPLNEDRKIYESENCKHVKNMQTTSFKRPSGRITFELILPQQLSKIVAFHNRI